MHVRQFFPQLSEPHCDLSILLPFLPVAQEIQAVLFLRPVTKAKPLSQTRHAPFLQLEHFCGQLSEGSVVVTGGHLDMSPFRAVFFPRLLQGTQTVLDRFGKVTLANPSSHSRQVPSRSQILQFLVQAFLFGREKPPLPFPPRFRPLLPSAVARRTMAMPNRTKNVFFMTIR